MKRLSTSATVIPALGALILVLMAQPASAKKPDFRAGTLCDFGVSIVQTGVQAERVTLPSGVIILTGQSTATVTNVENGVSRTYNVTGPTQFDPSTGRVTLLGPSIVFEPARDGFLIQTHGQVTFVVNEPIEEQVGTQTDICADLA
jgi:hypothetical protein